ncbi:SUMO-activating enzyme subunit 1 [Paramuricea clavata]|uniref:SUMO-activating enzyme subunit 1 n=1 Tax=Paramuricea clavata TaxID=317549 RepID=A0A7D9H8J4_PARCT|nr:SUMO-activating enzyme subunit 1 [Paramuricea clavata]
MADDRAMRESAESSITSISADEAALYDRQIRLWGLDAQKRLRASRVLLVGLTGLGAEICKNIVLCGVKSLTLLDDEVVTMQDFTAQFLIPRMDLGKNRAEACLVRAQRLNPMVEIKCDTEPVMKKSREYFEQFDVVILTGCVREVMIHVNTICHEKKIKFYAGDVFGYFGYTFNDLVEHKYVEEQKTSSGINLTVSEGPPAKKKPKQEEIHTIMVEKFLEFNSLKDALETSWVKNQKPKSLKRISKVFFIFQVLLRFQEKYRRNPEGSTSEQDIDDLLKMKNEVFESLDISQDLVLEDFARHCIGTLSPTSAILGGILAQDVIKALSGKDAPIDNFFFFDGRTGEGMIDPANKMNFGHYNLQSKDNGLPPAELALAV